MTIRVRGHRASRDIYHYYNTQALIQSWMGKKSSLIFTDLFKLKVVAFSLVLVALFANE